MTGKMTAALLAAMAGMSWPLVALAQDAEGEVPGAELKAKSAEVLNGAAIQALVSGKNMSDKSKSSERTIKLSSDGSVKARSSVFSGAKGFGKMGEGSGTWKVDGDKLCLEISWKTTDEKWCRALWKVGAQHYLVAGSGDKAKARPITVD